MAATQDLSHRILLARRPQGSPVADDFRLDEAPVPPLGPGEAQVRTIWLSLDPYMRGRMSDVVSEAGAQEFLARAPHAEYVDLAAGHMVAGDRNDAFTGAVLDFLQRHR